MKPQVELYDATDRDGDQTLGVSLSAAQKLTIAQADDRFGIPLVEVGFPESNAVDDAVFAALRGQPLQRAKYAAFGKTRRKGVRPEDDPGLRSLLATQAPVLTVVGKSSPRHVVEGLRATTQENLRMITDSVRFLGQEDARVIYDAEHFFDAYCSEGAEGRGYAMRTLRAAADGGARTLVLCETNGGQPPERVAEAVAAVCGEFHDLLIGIHAHNDRGMATANSRAAVLAGARHVQGTWNRTGERTGNADLVEVIGNLHLDGYATGADGNMCRLKQHAEEIARILRQPKIPNQPFVGERACAHKGGMHASCYPLYEFTDPGTFGNRRLIVGSKQAGLSNIRELVAHAKMLEDDLRARVLADPQLQRKILAEIKRLEEQGYRFDRADASLELLLLRTLDAFEPKIREVCPPVVHDVLGGETSATIKVQINGTQEVYHDVCEGDGPLGALSNALQKALRRKYASLEQFRLIDYRMEIAPGQEGTGSIVDVYAEFTDGEDTWVTTAASVDSIEAGWKSVVDGIEYKLLKDERSRLRQRASAPEDGAAES